MKYEFMHCNKEEFSIVRMARVLNVSESGYHKWRKRKESPPTERDKDDECLLQEIKDIYYGSRGSYGSRKITRIINKNRTHRVNHKRVERVMRENGLYSRVFRKYRITTDSNHDMMIADNLIDRDFEVEEPGQKMVSDTTVVETGEGDLYAAAILDLYGRLPVGLSMGRHNDRFLVMDAFKDMLIRGCVYPGCILHSDRGSTYASYDYRRLIDHYGYICSMSAKGDCWDNAPMESFWGKMKEEWLMDKYDTIAEAKRDIYEYVWSFYPNERPHQSNGYQTPSEYCGL